MPSSRHIPAGYNEHEYFDDFYLIKFLQFRGTTCEFSCDTRICLKQNSRDESRLVRFLRGKRDFLEVYTEF